MNDFDAIVKEICADPDPANAWHALIELEDGAIPALIRAFREEPDCEEKVWLLSAIAEFRQPLFEFYKECLFHPKKPIWNQAITALCMLGSTDAEKLLENVRNELAALRSESTKREYLDEAIELIREDRARGPQ